MSDSDVMDIVPDDLANIIVPTALGVGAWQFYVLSALTMGCALFSFFKFVRSVLYSNFRITSFRSSILILAFVAMAYRSVITFVCFNPWTKLWLTLWALGFPVYLQFITFSVLILFLVKEQFVITGKERFVTCLLYPFYVVIILLLSGLFVPFCIIISKKEIKSNDYDKELGLFIAILFGSSAIVMGTYGYLTHRNIVAIALEEKKQRKARRFMVIVTFYSFIFLARALWSLFKLFDANKLQDLMSEWIESDLPAYYTSYLLFYTIAEVVPAIVLLIVIDIMIPGKHKKAHLKEEKATEKSELIKRRDLEAEKCWDILCCNCSRAKKIFQETASSSSSSLSDTK